MKARKKKMLYKTDIEQRISLDSDLNEVAPMCEIIENYNDDDSIVLDEQHNLVIDMLFQLLATLNVKEITMVQIAYLVYRNWNEQSILVSDEKIDTMHSTYRVCEFNLHVIEAVSELSKRMICVNLYNAWKKAPLLKNIFPKKLIDEVSEKFENEYGTKRQYNKNDEEDLDRKLLKNRLNELIEELF
jgi:hypothetical protein